MAAVNFVNLRSLRGIGAILIFYHHFGFEGPVVRSFGDFAVSLFFFLSGLVLAATYKPAPRRVGSVARFLKTRLIKIYPLYLLSLLLATLIFGYNLRALPFDVLMLQSWIPLQDFYFSGNAVSWFVSTLFFSYVLFYPIMWGLQANIRRFIILFPAGIVLYIFIVISVWQPFVTGIIYISPVMQLPAFILGILVWKGYQKFDGHSLSPTLIATLQIIAIIIPVALMFTFDHIDPRWSLASYWWIPNIFLLYTMLVAERVNTPLNFLLRCKFMQTLGDISFVFYLFHTLVIALYQQTLAHFNLNPPMLLSSLICIALVVALSYLLHYKLELPLAAGLRNRFSA